MQQSRVHCNLSIGHAVVCHRSPRGLLLRSEEHTSELQSQSNLVCRLLLEKKKNVPTLSLAVPSPTRRCSLLTHFTPTPAITHTPTQTMHLWSLSRLYCALSLLTLPSTEVA